MSFVLFLSLKVPLVMSLFSGCHFFPLNLRTYTDCEASVPFLQSLLLDCKLREGEQNNVTTLIFWGKDMHKKWAKIKFKKFKFPFDFLLHFLMRLCEKAQVILCIFYLKPLHFSIVCSSQSHTGLLTWFWISMKVGDQQMQKKNKFLNQYFQCEVRSYSPDKYSGMTLYV